MSFADPSDNGAPVVPPTVAAAPGSHRSDHQNTVERPLPVAPSAQIMNLDEASVPAAPPVSTKTNAASRTKLPAPVQSVGDPGTAAPSAAAPQGLADPGANLNVPVSAPAQAVNDPGGVTSKPAKPPKQVWETNHPKSRPANATEMQNVPTADQPLPEMPGNASADPSGAVPPLSQGAADPVTTTPAAPKRSSVRFDPNAPGKDAKQPDGRPSQQVFQWLDVILVLT